MDHSYHSYFWKELSLFRDHIAVQQAWMNMLVAIPIWIQWGFFWRAQLWHTLISLCKN